MTMKQTTGALLGSYVLMFGSLAATKEWLQVTSLALGCVGASLAIVSFIYQIRKTRLELCKECGASRTCTVPAHKLPPNCPMKDNHEHS